MRVWSMTHNLQSDRLVVALIPSACKYHPTKAADPESAVLLLGNACWLSPNRACVGRWHLTQPERRNRPCFSGAARSSAPGTFETYRQLLRMSAHWGRPEVIDALSERRVWTQSGLGALYYSITSSARLRIDGGMVRPRALAVLRLMTSSKVFGCSTGRAPGN
jgi:hypothetical protein